MSYRSAAIAAMVIPLGWAFCGPGCTSAGSSVHDLDASAGSGGGAVVTCLSDKACRDLGLICNLSRHVCVECLTPSDCSNSDAAVYECNAGTCVSQVPCTNSLMCPPGQVCDKQRSRCVECTVDSDCGIGIKCSSDHRCRKPCTSDKDCKASTQLCDLTNNTCADCLKNTDCPMGMLCLDGSCKSQLCTPGATSCVGNGVALCSTDGKAWTNIVPCNGACIVIGGSARCGSADGGITSVAQDGAAVVSNAAALCKPNLDPRWLRVGQSCKSTDECCGALTLVEANYQAQSSVACSTSGLCCVETASRLGYAFILGPQQLCCSGRACHANSDVRFCIDGNVKDVGQACTDSSQCCTRICGCVDCPTGSTFTCQPWVQAASCGQAGASCTTSKCCAGLICDGSKCQPRPVRTCANVDESCAFNDDCCLGFGCSGGRCVLSASPPSPICGAGQYQLYSGGPCTAKPDSCPDGSIVCNCPETHHKWCHPVCEFRLDCGGAPNPDYPCH